MHIDRQSRALWLFNYRVSLAASYFPMWDMSKKPFIHFFTNGWRPGDRCLDMTLQVWRFGGSPSDETRET